MTKPFAAGWLDLREPYDRAARSRALLQSLTAWRQGRGRLQVVDLGAGTGANLRCTATALGGEQVIPAVALVKVRGLRETERSASLSCFHRLAPVARSSAWMAPESSLT